MHIHIYSRSAVNLSLQRYCARICGSLCRAFYSILLRKKKNDKKKATRSNDRVAGIRRFFRIMQLNDAVPVWKCQMKYFSGMIHMKFDDIVFGLYFRIPVILLINQLKITGRKRFEQNRELLYKTIFRKMIWKSGK